MKQGDAHGDARRFVGQALGKRVVGVVQHGLGNRPEDQADAHAGAEQHGDPGREAELWHILVGAQLEVAKAADGNISQHPKYSTDQRDVVPLEVVQDKPGGRFKRLGGLFILNGTKQYKQDHAN
ncbi:hypothetical protein D3C81_1542100 [compost metagenome]